MAELIEVYRGCEIYQELSGVFTSPCTVYARFTVERVREDIDAMGGAEPEPDPDPDKVFVETYRGVDIYYDNAVNRYWFEFENTPYSPATLNDAHTWIDTLLEPEPEPEPGWEYHSTYRGIDIQVWMPDGTPYTAYYDNEWHMAPLLSTVQAGIDAYLEPEPEPPAGEVTIKIVTTESDPYSRYHGMSIDQSLDSSFWTTQPDKIFKTTGTGFTYTQTVAVSEGSHYVIYGNSASSSYPWHAQIYVNDVLIAEGDVTRGNQLRGDFTAGEAPPTGIHTTTTITAPDKVGVDEKFNISGILYETEAGIPIPNQPINHSYNGRSLGSSITGVDGDYLKAVSVPEAGVWTIRSDFPGTEALQASRALVDAVVAATPTATALLIAGPIATGIALVIYGLS